MALRVRSPLQNGLLVFSGCLFALIGLSGLVVGRDSGDSWEAIAFIAGITLPFGAWLAVASWRQGVSLVGAQIVIRRPGKRAIRLEGPTAVHFDSYLGVQRQLGFGFILDCLAIESEDGSRTQLPGIGVWRRFPGHERINLERAMSIDDMIYRIQTGASRAQITARREHFRQLQKLPTAAPRHQTPT